MLKIKFRKTNSIKTISINNFQIKAKMYFFEKQFFEQKICQTEFLFKKKTIF